MEEQEFLYENDVVYRPPTEHNSVLLEVTVGCTYRKCAYCACTCFEQGKFRMIGPEVVAKNISLLARDPKNRQRSGMFFLGLNVFALSTARLMERFNLVQEHMPWIKRISMYARADDVLRKTRRELEELKRSGLGDLYIGLESGSDRVLNLCNKGVDAGQMLRCFQMLDYVGIPYNLSSIVGLGGREHCWEHATETAALYNKIHPKTIRIMALTVWPGTKMDQAIQSGAFIKLTPEEEVLEQRLLLENLTVENCVFIASHLSNSAPLSGYLQEDKEIMMDKMDSLIYSFDLSGIEKRKLDLDSGW